MRLRLTDRGDGGERGAIAILTAMLSVVLLAVGALAVDITTQVNQRQKLHDTIDASAHAGAFRLPSNGAGAKADALASAAVNYPLAPAPVVDLFCVVASKWNGSTWVVDATQIPATCNPASAGGVYTVSSTLKCNSKICAIPCNGPSDVCNTVRVSGEKDVPFSLGPVVGVNKGGTGSVTSAACKGSCGTISPNPMDVAVVADRTGSMSATDINAMVAGIKSMFTKMTPSQQYVALGTIGRSTTTNHSTAACNSSSQGLSWPSGSATTGAWVPVNFSYDYLNPDKTVKTTDPLVKAVNCLTNSSSTGTHLASPMKAAARILLGPSAPYDTSSNLTSLPARVGTVRKAIIFETDGEPTETTTTSTLLRALNTSGDIENTNGETACTNFKAVATNAKTADILVVTVGFNVATARCGGSSGSYVDDVLAAAASEKAPGVPSAANFNCGDTTPGGGQYKENNDLDYFFCAGTGADMAAIFATAFGQLSTGIRLLQLP